MTELLATLPTAEQASRIIAADIKAYPQGGDKREQHLRLFGAVLSREVIKGAWAARYAELRKDAAAPRKFERREFSDRQIARWQAERASFFSSAAQPAAAPEPEDTPEPEAAQAEPKPRAALPAVIPPQPPPASWDDLLTVMNNQHAIIDNVGGKTVIASWEASSLDPTRQIIAFQNKDSFVLRYSNRYATIEITTKRGATTQADVPLSQWWLTHSLTDQEAIGVVVKKHRTSSANGWEFPLLSECRAAWSKLYGPTEWDTDMADWGEAVEVAQPRSKPEKPAEAMAEPANANAKPAAAAGWRRF